MIYIDVRDRSAIRVIKGYFTLLGVFHSYDEAKHFVDMINVPNLQ